MKQMFTVAVGVVLVAMLAWPQAALAQSKTAKQCNDEWAANEAALQASGKTKPAFVAECRGVAVAAASAAALPASGQFATAAEARASCPSDAVVWINPKSRIYHPDGSRNYGKTKQGAYMCEQQSLAAGFRAAKSPKRASI